MMAYYSSQSNSENKVYFYHADHLGSASWITNHNGDAVQHIQYLPYGEPYVNERPFGYSERFLFTGKERDEETGYGYFGARYMDHELMTMWLSVDPMSDKYPNISPYAYCAWNPIKLIDPDGKDVWEVDKNGHVKRTGDDGGENKQTIKYANGKTTIHEGIFYHSIFSSLSKEKEIPGDDEHTLSSHHGGKMQGAEMANVFYDMVTNTNVEWRLDYTKDKKFILSSKHDEEHSPATAALGLSISNIYSTIHSHPSAEADYTKEIESMGIVRSKGFIGGDYSLRNKQPKSLKSYVFMKNSRRAWELRPFDNPGRVGDSKGNDVLFSNGSLILKLLKL